MKKFQENSKEMIDTKYTKEKEILSISTTQEINEKENAKEIKDETKRKLYNGLSEFIEKINSIA